MNTATQDPAVVQQILMEITIDAPRERVWKALVEETGAWWHKDFYTGRDPVGFHMQPKLGGWIFEDWGGGEGAIWGTVIGVRAPEMLQAVGDSGPDYGGPNRGMMSWDLTPSGDDDAATVVRFRHALHGSVAPGTVDSLDGGWRLLFETCLKAYVETGTRPAAADADAGPCEA